MRRRFQPLGLLIAQIAKDGLIMDELLSHHLVLIPAALLYDHGPLHAPPHDVPHDAPLGDQLIPDALHVVSHFLLSGSPPLPSSLLQPAPVSPLSLVHLFSPIPVFRSLLLSLQLAQALPPLVQPVSLLLAFSSLFSPQRHRSLQQWEQEEESHLLQAFQQVDQQKHPLLVEQLLPPF